jgi:hypothetical protein
MPVHDLDHRAYSMVAMAVTHCGVKIVTVQAPK